MFQAAPNLYFEKVIKGNEVPDIAEKFQAFNQQNIQDMQKQLAQGGQLPETRPQQPSPQDTTRTPTEPAQGSPRGLIGRARNAIGSMFGG